MLVIQIPTNKPLQKQKYQHIQQTQNKVASSVNKSAKQYMSLQIQENLTKILKNQNCKRRIESQLITRRGKKISEQINKDRIQLGYLLFQVVKDSVVTDHMHLFPCVFDLETTCEGRLTNEVPKVGSFIRTKKMDFDLKSCILVIYDYQYLGGSGSSLPSHGQRVNWTSETISQIIRKNNIVKGGQILLDSYQNDKLSQKEPFQYPKVQFVTVKLLQSMLTDPRLHEQQSVAGHKIEKISVPKMDVQQEKVQESCLDSIKVEDKNIHNVEI